MPKQKVIKPKRKPKAKRQLSKDGKIIQTVNVYTSKKSSGKKTNVARPISTTDMLLSTLLKQSNMEKFPDAGIRNHDKSIYLPSNSINSILPKSSTFSTAEPNLEKPTMEFQTDTPSYVNISTQTSKPGKVSRATQYTEPIEFNILTDEEPIGIQSEDIYNEPLTSNITNILQKSIRPKMTKSLIKDVMNYLGSNEENSKKNIQEQFDLGFTSKDIRELILKPAVESEENVLKSKGLLESIKKGKKLKSMKESQIQEIKEPDIEKFIYV